MTTEALLTEIRDSMSDISGHLENISNGINFRPDSVFTHRVAHVLTCDLFDQDKLNCIRVLYRQMAWPEIPLTFEETVLLAKIK